MLKYLIPFVFLISLNSSIGQSITGQMSNMDNQKIQLHGFNGISSYLVAETTTDASGKFSFNYNKTANFGVGILHTGENSFFKVLLNGEDIELQGAHFNTPESITITQGPLNKNWVAYKKQHTQREQALNSLQNLKNLYTVEAPFLHSKSSENFLKNEIERIEKQHLNFMNSLPEDSFLKWLLPVEKLINSVPQIAEQNPEKIPTTRQAISKLNLADARLHKSGLFANALQSEIWLINLSIENPDLRQQAIHKTIDVILEQLKSNEPIYNQATGYLFNLFESNNLTSHSEYIALKALQEESCALEEGLSNQLEAYRSMKEGNTAPDIEFTEATYFAEGVTAKKLSEFDSEYTLVVFAAGWCPHCTEMTPKLAKAYPQWKAKNIEVLLVSLDQSATDFAQFTASLPFTSTTDYQSWEGKAAKEYYISATPTMYLLDKNQKIISRIQSVAHLDGWVQENLNP